MTETRLRSVIRAWPLAILGLQFALFSESYGLHALFSTALPWYVDHLYHLYQISLSADLWQKGVFNGYDSRFGAGYIGGAVYNWSAKTPVVLVLASQGFLSAAAAYKIVITLFVISGPWLVSVAARRIDAKPLEALIAGLVCMMLWWASYLSWYVTAGMVSYVWSACLAAYVGPMVYRQAAERLRVGGMASLAFISAAGWWIHPHFPLLVAFFVAPLLAADGNRAVIHRALVLAGFVSIFAFATNAPWILAMVQGSRLNDVETLGAYPFQREVDLMRIFYEAAGSFGTGATGAKIYPFMLAATLAALRWAPKKRRRRSLAYLVVWLATQLFAYLGGAFELVAKIEPNRIAPVGYLLLVAPTVWGCSAIATRLNLNSFVFRVDRSALTACVVLLGLLVYPILETAREVLPGKHGRYGFAPPQFREPSSEFQRLADLIDRKRRHDGRVLLEQSSARVFDNAHIAGLLALRTSAEFIGGPYATNDGKNFKDGRLLGSSVGEMDDATLRSILEGYAIELIVVHSGSAKQRFDTLAGVTKIASIGAATVYRNEYPVSFFCSGAGRVQSRWAGGVEFAAIEGAPVCVKYHWYENLTTHPFVPIEAGLHSPDGRSFVLLPRPTESLRITTLHLQ